MLPLAKLWTWIGQTFIPVAIAWAVYVRGGLAGEQIEESVLISRGYWGLLVALAVGTSLAIVALLYARETHRSKSRSCIPTNTTLDETGKSIPISRGTAVIFILFVLGSLGLFGGRYADSRIHAWEGISPLASGFWSSRLKAHEGGCGHGPCYAVAERLNLGHPISGVNEYVLYLTDGILVLLIAALIVSMVLLGISCIQVRPPTRYGR
jgi:hypothetical protein